MNSALKICILFVLCVNTILGDEIDSLRAVLKKTNFNDTSRISLQLAIGEMEGVYRLSFWDSLKVECESKLNSAKPGEKLFYQKNLAVIINDLGFVADEQGKTDKALEAYNKALSLFEQLDDKKGIARAFNNIGAVYDNLGDLSLAIDYYYKSLNIREVIKDTSGLASCHNNIGYLYFKQKNYKKALESYKKASHYAKLENNLYRSAIILGNFGLTYSTMKDYDQALNYYMEAKKIYDTYNYPINQSQNISNIAAIYKNQGNLQLALSMYMRSLQIMDSLDYKQGQANVYSSIANIYFTLGDIKKAQANAETGLKLARELGYPKEISSCGMILAEVYQRTGNFKDAFFLYVRSKKLADSLNNDDLRRETLQKDLQHEYDRKVAADSLNLVLERHSNELKVKEEKNKRFFLYGGLVVLLFVTLFVFNRLRITKKQNQIIAKQKLEVESQKELIVKQKELVEEKQKEIVDSINYAKRIQQAVLTGNEVWQNIAKDHFILFQPKDIVSGDFYWATNVNSNLSIFALADCTGHGVPGGFMSMLGNSFLNEIIVEKKIYQPGEILNQLRNKIIKALAQEGQSNQKDGMDICLCAYDKKKGTLDFAGANNPLWIVNPNEITEYKGDKMPIGVYVNELKPFSNTTIDLKDGDCLYLITDGFADQFGGEKGKKFKYKPLMELLQKNQQRSMKEQGNIFLSVINEWKKGYEQVDDISLIGIRV